MKNENLLSQLPVFEHIGSLCATLKNSPSRFLVLTAETGAGKSTVLPLGLLENFPGKILMTQPRRLSVLGTSSRMADLLGEKVGDTCGYRIHLDSRISSATRLEVVTEAILLRMLQDDFSLEGYNVVVLDEFHERSCSLDLISCFLKEAMVLRDDLFVVIMSATIDAEKIASYFDGAPVVRVPGRAFPVETEYRNGVSPENAVIQELSSSSEGDILVFLPGLREIRNCISALGPFAAKNPGVELHCLHSSISAADQKKILVPAEDGHRRVIVSSAIAETSVTVPGVTCVIDSGLCRMKIHDPSTGMEKLVTAPESEFSAGQRAGRAGRTQRGKCVRLWSRNDVRQKEVLPEILRSDLTSVILECAERGVSDPKKAGFLDMPSESLWNESLFLLQGNGMVDAEGKITPKGKCAVKLPLDVRLAGVVLASYGNAVLEDFAKDVFLRNSEFAGSAVSLKEKSWNDIVSRMKKAGWSNVKFPSDKRFLLLEGFADRLAKKIPGAGGDDEWQFASGRKARLHPSVKVSSEWIVATETDAGLSSAVIFAAEEISGDEFLLWLEGHVSRVTECRFEKGEVRKEEKTCFGKIILASRKIPAADGDFASAWREEFLRKGLDCLPLDEPCRKFLLRAEFYRQQKNGGTETERELKENFDMWLTPFLGGVKRLDPGTVLAALRWYFDGQTVDREVPESLEFSNGRKIKVIYEKNDRIRPVVEVIIQRIFGCFSTPRIMGEKVLLKLLSPASRPLQITDDLENFWNTSWIDICREMKGRYPKHNWDYRIAEDQ